MLKKETKEDSRRCKDTWSSSQASLGYRLSNLSCTFAESLLASLFRHSDPATRCHSLASLYYPTDAAAFTLSKQVARDSLVRLSKLGRLLGNAALADPTLTRHFPKTFLTGSDTVLVTVDFSAPDTQYWLSPRNKGFTSTDSFSPQRKQQFLYLQKWYEISAIS